MMMMRPNLSILVAVVVSFCCSLQVVSSFSFNTKLNNVIHRQKSSSKNIIISQQPTFNDDEETFSSTVAIDQSANKKHTSLQQSLLAGCITFITCTPLAAFAATAVEELEIEELPPVYVPILFAIVIIGGVGVLTASLGDVYTEEASLGLQSGARAKKERERSRSSYFKK